MNNDISLSYTYIANLLVHMTWRKCDFKVICLRFESWFRHFFFVFIYFGFDKILINSYSKIPYSTSYVPRVGIMTSPFIEEAYSQQYIKTVTSSYIVWHYKFVSYYMDLKTLITK